MKKLVSFFLWGISAIVFIAITPFVLFYLYCFGFLFAVSYLPHWGERNPEAMSDQAVVRYVEERIPIGSGVSVIETFIEQEKDEWPYYSDWNYRSKDPNKDDRYYSLKYDKGTFKSWLGKSHCNVYVFIDKEDKVSEIKLHREIYPLPFP